MKLFKAEDLRRSERLGEVIHECIFQEENIRLEVILTAAKIWKVVKNMHSTKASAPDGMPAIFFQKYWDIVGGDVILMVQNVFWSGLLPRDINRSFVVLIPKVHGVSEFKHLQPISLCNTIYKIISKILTDRSKPLLSKIISSHRAAFVPNTWIGENVVLANELMHSIKIKKRVRGIVGIKVDMQKAYDRVDWVVITQILLLLRFLEKFVKLVLNCISSVSMELLLNGSVFGKIPMERGLRQGDPISPFIFIIMAELLSRMLHKWESDNKFHGVKLGRLSPLINHLMFADDIIIFFRANVDEVRNIQRCLHLYCKWTSQAFNREKSRCFFSRNVTGIIKANIKSWLGMKDLDKSTKHLGLPFVVGKNKSSTFDKLIMKIQSKFQTWIARLLSQTGRAILIKHVASSISVYSMSSFLLPKGWCENLEKLARGFLWKNDVQASRGFVPMSWRKICQLKRLGCLGFRNLWRFNKALSERLVGAQPLMRTSYGFAL